MSEAIGAGFGAYLAAHGRMPSTGDALRPGGDDRMIVLFSRRPVQNEAQSMTAGRPIFDAVDFVRIQHPGERDYVERPVQESDKHRWPRQWAAYQQEQQQVPEGTPLDVLFPGQPQIVAALRYVNILTVEHLATAEGNALSNIGPGANDWKRRAVALLEASKSAAPMHALEKALEERDAQIAKQAGEIDALRAKLDRLMDRMGDEDEAPRRRRQPAA